MANALSEPTLDPIPHDRIADLATDGESKSTRGCSTGSVEHDQVPSSNAPPASLDAAVVSRSSDAYGFRETEVRGRASSLRLLLWGRVDRIRG